MLMTMLLIIHHIKIIQFNWLRKMVFILNSSTLKLPIQSFRNLLTYIINK